MLKVTRLEKDEDRPQEEDYHVVGSFSDAMDTIKAFVNQHRDGNDIQWLIEKPTRAIAVTAAINILEEETDKAVEDDSNPVKMFHFITAYTMVTKMLIGTVTRLKTEDDLLEEGKVEILSLLQGSVTSSNEILPN